MFLFVVSVVFQNFMTNNCNTIYILDTVKTDFWVFTAEVNLNWSVAELLILQIFSSSRIQNLPNKLEIIKQ